MVSDWLPQVFRLLTDLHDLCSQSDLDMERFVKSALVSYSRKCMIWKDISEYIKHSVIQFDFN